ncbi:uncharacterized protein TNCV_4418501 [Trichonephila clavipes]|nr:uncharacterized protein TNCV_4418501 [Trichonephila clavipes]
MYAKRPWKIPSEECSLCQQDRSYTRYATREFLATDHVILNHGQVTRTTPGDVAPPLLTTTPHQREDVLALNRFNVHRCPTRRVFSGTGLELVDTYITRLPRPQARRGKKLSTTALYYQSVYNGIEAKAEWFVHHAFTPQVRGSNPGLDKIDSAFHAFSGSINAYLGT